MRCEARLVIVFQSGSKCTMLCTHVQGFIQGGAPGFPPLPPPRKLPSIILIYIIECDKINNFHVCVVPEGIRNRLRDCSNFLGGGGAACPQIPLASVRYCTLEFPPLRKKSCINPCMYICTESYFN